MSKFLFVNLPVMEMWNPSAAMAALTPIIKNAGLEPVHVDVNIDIWKSLTSTEWNDLSDWCNFIKDDIDPKIIDTIMNSFDHSFSDISNVSWIGISVFSFVNARLTEQLLNFFKQKLNKNIKIVIGGNGCSSSLASFNQQQFGEYCLEKKIADFVIYADGEYALKELLSGNTEYPGINFNNPQQIKNLDELPLPDYTSMDFSKYEDSRILVTGSRGCVRKCTFCDIELTWPKYAYRNPELIVDEMRKHVNELGITNFEFTDSLINGSGKNFDKFNELLANAKEKEPEMKNVTYMGQAICKNKSGMKPHVYELMHHAGCKLLTVGIESFSERVRSHMKKKFSDSDIDYHLEQSSRWGIPNVFLMIVGYPTETRSDHRSQLKSIRKYADYAKTGAIHMLRWGLTMHIYEDTPITRYTEELKLMHTGHEHHDSLFTWVSGVNPGLDLKERIRRRLEVHELSHAMGYPMPNAREELTSLLKLAEIAEHIPKKPNFIPIKNSKAS